MPHKTILEEISKSDFGLQLNSKYYPYALSTKIYEYAGLRVPCISINYGGDIEALISDSRIGYSINLNRDDLKGFLVKLSERNLTRDFRFNVGQYHYSNLAQKYSRVIESLWG